MLAALIFDRQGRLGGGLRTAGAGYDWWRRKWTGEIPTDVLPDAGSLADSAIADERRDLVVALATLPRANARSWCSGSSDLTERETADALGVSVGTVKSQTARALARLRASHLLTEDD